MNIHIYVNQVRSRVLVLVQYVHSTVPPWCIKLCSVISVKVDNTYNKKPYNRVQSANTGPRWLNIPLAIARGIYIAISDHYIHRLDLVADCYCIRIYNVTYKPPTLPPNFKNPAYGPAVTRLQVVLQGHDLTCNTVLSIQRVFRSEG